MNRYLAEFISTFFLVFVGTGAIVIDEVSEGTIGNLGIAVSFGLIVTVMIFAFARISGAHMNPAVTLTLVLQRLHPAKDLLPYVLVQLAGGVLASTLLWSMFPANELLGATYPKIGGETTSFVFEFILTFLLMLVILFTSNGRRIEQYFAPLAIGLTVLLEALFAGPVCGASMNPARSFGPAIASFHFEYLWIYLFATTLGAITAGYYWKFHSHWLDKQ